MAGWTVLLMCGLLVTQGSGQGWSTGNSQYGQGRDQGRYGAGQFGGPGQMGGNSLEPFRSVFEWNSLEFNWPDEVTKQQALQNRRFIPENNALAGIKVWRDRIFVTVPRWKEGVPVTLASLSSQPVHTVGAPRLDPFPNWQMQEIGNCSSLQFVQSMEIDTEGRIWILDTGRTNILSGAGQTGRCPPKLVIIDLNSVSFPYANQFGGTGQYPNQPYNPTNPNQPYSPNQPYGTGQPYNPSNPNQPYNPSNPNQPYNPANPNQPYNPANPNQPYNPANPNQPYNPANPNQPYNPANPNQPYNPANPNQPYNPANPNQPYNPANPNQPYNPANPNQPYNPANPNQPYNPANPNQPYNPANPNQPYNPANPNQPYNPANPNQPYNPANPNQPYNPANPNQQYGTQYNQQGRTYGTNPNQPYNPANPNQPYNPANPTTPYNANQPYGTGQQYPGQYGPSFPYPSAFQNQNFRIVKSFNFPSNVAQQFGSHLNDIVLDNANGWYAYITDHGEDPGIIVYSFREDRAWKVKDVRSMRADPDTNFISINSIDVELRGKNVDGIALSPAAGYERTLYYSPLGSYNLYSVPTSVLKNANQPSDISSSVRDLGRKQSVTDGMIMDNRGNLYFGLLGLNAIGVWNSQSGRLDDSARILARDNHALQWADTFAIDDGGNLWVVTNRLQNFLTGRVNLNEPNYRILRASLGLRSYMQQADLSQSNNIGGRYGGNDPSQRGGAGYWGGGYNSYYNSGSAAAFNFYLLAGLVAVVLRR